MPRLTHNHYTLVYCVVVLSSTSHEESSHYSRVTVPSCLLVCLTHSVSLSVRVSVDSTRAYNKEVNPALGNRNFYQFALSASDAAVCWFIKATPTIVDRLSLIHI